MNKAALESQHKGESGTEQAFAFRSRSLDSLSGLLMLGLGRGELVEAEVRKRLGTGS